MLSPLERANEKLQLAKFEGTPVELSSAEAKAILEELQRLHDAAEDSWYERSTRV